MIRRSRLFLFAFALMLTGLALSPKVRASECTDGQFGWVDFGTCCPFVPYVQLLRAHCVDGAWEVVPNAGYKCLFNEPC